MAGFEEEFEKIYIRYFNDETETEIYSSEQ